MMTWTFVSSSPRACVAVVSADNTEMACRLLEEKLASIGCLQPVKPEQLIPFVTSTRYARILWTD
jgi:hypothetical protein